MLEYEFDKKIDKCIICNSHDIKLHKTDFRKINISKCNECDFQFMNPQYTDKYLSLYYSTYTTAEDFEHVQESLSYGHNFYFSLIEKYIAQGKLLDIGCGNGHLLRAAIKRGWSGQGYDVDKESTQITSDRLGVKVYSGDFFSNQYNNNYDLITLHQVLEHLKNPNEYLEKIYSLIKNNGYIFIAVPNISSLSSKIKFSFEKLGLRRKNIGKYYDTNHHVLYFEPKTLNKLLENHGFKVVYQRNCHSAKPKQSKFKRFIMRNFTDYLFAKSTFLVIAKKI